MATTTTEVAGALTGSKSTWLYNEIRNRIIRGEYAPGSRLRERDLADEFGVSRMPIRETLPQLEAEGFIEVLPRRGAIVTQLTLRDVEEVFEARLGVEVYGTRLAAMRVAGGAPTTDLDAALKQSADALDSGDDAAIAESSALFHDAITLLADNSLLVAMLQVVSGRDRWIFELTATRDQYRACAEHQALHSAIVSGNADLAASIAYAHIEHGRQESLESLAQVLPTGD